MERWTDKSNPEFERWWATKTAEGYQYGREALENVRFGFEGAQLMRWQPIDSAPRDRRFHLVAKIENEKVVWWARAKFIKGTDWKHEGGWCVPSHWLPLPLLETT